MANLNAAFVARRPSKRSRFNTTLRLTWKGLRFLAASVTRYLGQGIHLLIIKVGGTNKLFYILGPGMFTEVTVVLEGKELDCKI